MSYQDDSEAVQWLQDYWDYVQMVEHGNEPSLNEIGGWDGLAQAFTDEDIFNQTVGYISDDINANDPNSDAGQLLERLKGLKQRYGSISKMKKTSFTKRVCQYIKDNYDIPEKMEFYIGAEEYDFEDWVDAYVEEFNNNVIEPYGDDSDESDVKVVGDEILHVMTSTYNVGHVYTLNYEEFEDDDDFEASSKKMKKSKIMKGTMIPEVVSILEEHYGITTMSQWGIYEYILRYENESPEEIAYRIYDNLYKDTGYTSSTKKMKIRKENVTEIEVNGQPYYIWESFNGFKGSKENPNQFITDARAVLDFNRNDGFDTIQDVIDYINQYFVKSTKKMKKGYFDDSHYYVVGKHANELYYHYVTSDGELTDQSIYAMVFDNSQQASDVADELYHNNPTYSFKAMSESGYDVMGNRIRIESDDYYASTKKSQDKDIHSMIADIRKSNNSLVKSRVDLPINKMRTNRLMEFMRDIWAVFRKYGIFREDVSEENIFTRTVHKFLERHFEEWAVRQGAVGEDIIKSIVTDSPGNIGIRNGLVSIYDILKDVEDVLQNYEIYDKSLAEDIVTYWVDNFLNE